ncbi:MAG: DUF4177 domain-containing protein [Chloroflexi bacterium]|nr:DUF4177 domain-containing protein [Chloroflexota bacterium]
MERFEYKCVSIWGGGEKTTRILNEYARDGWELIAVCWVWHYFKRRVPGA